MEPVILFFVWHNKTRVPVGDFNGRGACMGAPSVLSQGFSGMGQVRWFVNRLTRFTCLRPFVLPPKCTSRYSNESGRVGSNNQCRTNRAWRGLRCDNSKAWVSKSRRWSKGYQIASPSIRLSTCQSRGELSCRDCHTKKKNMVGKKNGLGAEICPI